MKNQSPEFIKNIAIDGCLFKKAIDDLEIHPKSIETSAGITHAEEYKKGWNDAIKEQFTKYIAFSKFIGALKPQAKKALENLLINDVIELSYNLQVIMWININDVFVPAADSETIYLYDLIKINEVYDKFGHDGIIAWIANTRGTEPLSYKYKKNYKYKTALKYIKNKSSGNKNKRIIKDTILFIISCAIGGLLFKHFIAPYVFTIGLLVGAIIHVFGIYLLTNRNN